jgi:hypothetical protein
MVYPHSKAKSAKVISHFFVRAEGVDKKGMTLTFLRRSQSWNRRSHGKEKYTDERGNGDDLPVAQGNKDSVRSDNAIK